MELPFGGRTLIGWRFPPTARRYDVVAAVAVDVAPTDAVVKLAGHVDPLRRNGGNAPLGHRVFVASRDAHKLERSVGFLRFRRGAHQHFLRAVAVDVEVFRALVVRHVGDHIASPRPRHALRVFEPHGRLSREFDDEQVVPAVAVEVFRPSLKALAVLERIEIAGLLAHGVQLPVGRGVIAFAGGDVELAVVVEIADGHAFGAKLRIDVRLLKRDLFGKRGGSQCRSESEGEERACHGNGP